MSSPTPVVRGGTEGSIAMQKGSHVVAAGAAKRLALAAVLAAAWVCAGCAAPSPPAGPAVVPATGPAGPGLSTRDGRLYRNGRPYRGVGANYYDLFQRILRNPKDDSTLRGLEALGAAGIPFVRFNAGGFQARDWKLYLEDKAEFFRRMDLVVRTAERCNVGLIPSMFWTFVLPDLVGEHRDQWGNADSKTIALMREVVRDFVTRYKDSPALWAWEFGNELNLALDLPNAQKFRKKGGTERDDLTSAHAAVMLREFARAVREHDAHRPVLAGNSHPRFCAWNNTHNHNWKEDTRRQMVDILLRDNAATDDISVHLYGEDANTKEMARWTDTHAGFLRVVRKTASDAGKVLWVGEFGTGLQSDQDEPRCRRIFEDLLADLERAEVDLAAFWIFDLPTQPQWTVTPDNARAWVLHWVAAANRRWNRLALQPPPR